MFYVLSKILDVLLTPIAWTAVLVLVGATGRDASRLRRAMAPLGVVVLLLFSEERVSNALFHVIEAPAPKTMRADMVYDVVILLGGVTDERVEATWGERAFNDNNERLLAIYDLLRSGAARAVIASGGAAAATPTDMVEAAVLGRQLVAWGIAPDRVIIEDRARNTHENAVLSAAIVRDHGWKNILVVTSAFHMPRAYGCFVAEGLAVDTLPVDFRSFDTKYGADPLPRADHLAESTAAIREWFGRVVYRARGYSR